MLKQQIECPYAIVFNSNDNGNEDDNNASSKMCICKGKHLSDVPKTASTSTAFVLQIN